MRKLALTVGTLALLASTTAAQAEVRVTLQRGHVTIVAKDATVRQILAEWARIGQTKIVNAERLPGGPVTLELTDVPEQQAIDILLRAVSGYVAAPRAAIVANASVFDRIVIMPTTVTAAPAVNASASPVFTQPVPAMPRPVFDDQDDDRPFPPAPGQGRPPMFAIPPPPVTNPQMPAVMPGVSQGQQVFPPGAGAAAPPPFTPYPGAPTTSMPAGSSAPGMVVPAPQPVGGQPIGPGGAPGPPQ